MPTCTRRPVALSCSSLLALGLALAALPACINLNSQVATGATDTDTSTTTDGTTTTTTTMGTTLTSTTTMTTMTTTTTTTGDGCDGDLFCEVNEGEDQVTCLHDCGECNVDGACDDASETPHSCPAECPATGCDHNGKVDALTEQCDDGNMEDADACTNACAHAVCGDTIVQAGVEECDLGSENGDDKACTSECKNNVCGDGKVHAGVEACDLGSENGDDKACTSGCENNVCGDGKVHAGVEECDDGNKVDLDGCSSGCVVERRLVFVTSTLQAGNLGGLDGADATCQTLGNDESKTFKAWLSDGAGSPSTRFGIDATFKGPFELVDGTVVAQGWEDLTDGTLMHAIDVDEMGNKMIVSSVWTNTTQEGTSLGMMNCSNWSSNLFNVNGWIGGSSEVEETWTNGQSNSCSSSARLYCFQTE